MSSSDRNKAPALVDERDALSVYFEALLREEPLEEEAQPLVVPVAPVVAPAPTVAPPVVETVTTVAVEAVTQPEEDTVPGWGKDRFQAMLFTTAGLTLAVPLVELSGVQEWDVEKVTPMPGHAEWYLGLMLYRDRNVPVVDTALLVLPPDRLANVVPPEQRMGRVVFIEDGTWGLACDSVAEVISLEPEQVRWRTSRTRRRWLAGTVIDHMCAIIDPPAFGKMLATGLEDDTPETGLGERKP